jgi:hypothetical protein
MAVPSYSLPRSLRRQRCCIVSPMPAVNLQISSPTSTANTISHSCSARLGALLSSPSDSSVYSGPWHVTVTGGGAAPSNTVCSLSYQVHNPLVTASDQLIKSSSKHKICGWKNTLPNFLSAALEYKSLTPQLSSTYSTRQIPSWQENSSSSNH